MIHYVSSKGGILAFTRALAREVGPYNINVNALAPGLTETNSSLRISGPELIKMETEKRCIKRIEQPEDLVGTMMFLASEDSDFISGQTILVDGGVALH